LAIRATIFDGIIGYAFTEVVLSSVRHTRNMLKTTIRVFDIEYAIDKQIDDLLCGWVPKVALRQLERIRIGIRVPWNPQNIVGGAQSSGAIRRVFVPHSGILPLIDPTTYLFNTAAIHGERVKRVVRMHSATES
jgi:hypothetical protein